MSLENLVEQLRRDNASFNTLFPNNDRNISKIIGRKEGEQKLVQISRLSDFLIEQGFNSYHCFSIVVGKGWEEKLEWIAENYETLLKPMEFNGYHVSQIVRNKGWEEK
ncbi:MAG: hypothetical protein O2779_03845, partial [Nanoarchaeota archaeon]|nr:hypothetical protein [Nanoarchaeota archaeon]